MSQKLLNPNYAFSEHALQRESVWVYLVMEGRESGIFLNFGVSVVKFLHYQGLLL